jgi:pilus assembly protein Flp/PilA
MERITNFLQDESGASAVEYALLIALIAVACIYAIQMLGIDIAAAFTTVANVISAAS